MDKVTITHPQEMQLFLGLIKRRIIPDYAVFINGLNDTGPRINDRRELGYDEPRFTPEIKSGWDAKRGAPIGHRESLGQQAWGHEPVVEPSLLFRIPWFASQEVCLRGL